MSLMIDVHTESTTTSLEGQLSPKFDASSLPTSAVASPIEKSESKVDELSTVADANATAATASTAAVKTSPVTSLAGSYLNIQSTRITINAVDPITGQFTGTFEGGAQSPYPTSPYPLYGQQDLTAIQPAFSFYVLWGTTNSSTSFSGRYDPEVSPERIDMLWVTYTTGTNGSDALIRL